MSNSLPSFPLWTDKAPLSLGNQPQDIPTLTPFIPEKINPKKPAVVVCPGGGYANLADHEGTDYALYLQQNGIAAFVLKYRLGSNGYRHPAMLLDAARAVRTLRHRAAEFGINPNIIGIMGSSAGGHLTSTLITHFDNGDAASSDPIDRVSSRPDFAILCYAVVSMIPGINTHSGSRAQLLGENPTQAQMESVSNELHVTPQTSPCFIWHTTEDQSVPVLNSCIFAQELQKNGVPYDLHIYQKGRHGIGLVDKTPFAKVHPWAKDLLFWLRENSFIE